MAVSDKLPPFAPPSQKTLDEAIRPEVAEAKELSLKLAKGTTPDPVGFEVNHDRVGNWVKGQRVSIKEVKEELQSDRHHLPDSEVDGAIARLVELNALVPFFE